MIPLMYEDRIPNYDEDSGIYYGAISQYEVSSWAMDDFIQEGVNLNLITFVEEIVATLKRAVEWYADSRLVVDLDESLRGVISNLLVNEPDELLLDLRGVVVEEFKDMEVSLFDMASQPLLDIDTREKNATVKNVVHELWESIEQGVFDCADFDNPDILYRKDGYRVSNALDSDLIVERSPYMTYAPECSLCIPQAGNLNGAIREEEWDLEDPDGRPTFCLGPEWFEDKVVPYPYWSVSTKELLKGLG